VLDHSSNVICSPRWQARFCPKYLSGRDGQDPGFICLFIQPVSGVALVGFRLPVLFFCHNSAILVPRPTFKCVSAGPAPSIKWPRSTPEACSDPNGFMALEIAGWLLSLFESLISNESQFRISNPLLMAEIQQRNRIEFFLFS